MFLLVTTILNLTETSFLKLDLRLPEMVEFLNKKSPKCLKFGQAEILRDD